MWYKAEYSNMPLEIDNVSSSEYVYVRRNIAKEEKKNEDDVETIYVCEEQKILKKDWELYENILSHNVELSEIQDALIELSEIISGV